MPGNVGGIKMIQDCYYVQGLTDQIFLVRERMSANGEQGPDDRIVKSFIVPRRFKACLSQAGLD